jgi:hypothetical protein
MGELHQLLGEIKTIEVEFSHQHDQKFFGILDLLSHYGDSSDGATQFQISLYYAEFCLHDLACWHVYRALMSGDASLPSSLLSLLTKSCMQVGQPSLVAQLLARVQSDNDCQIHVMAAKCLRDLYSGHYGAALDSAAAILVTRTSPVDAQKVANDALVTLFETSACSVSDVQHRLTFEYVNCMPREELNLHSASRQQLSFSTRWQSYVSPLSCLVDVKPLSAFPEEQQHGETGGLLQQSQKIKAFLHCHSEAGLRLFLHFFADTLRGEFDVYLTSTDHALSLELVETFAEVRFVDNVGMRDYASKIVEFWGQSKGDELCLFTHCKESSSYWLYHANRQLFDRKVIDFVRSFNHSLLDHGSDVVDLGVILPSPPPHVPAKVFGNQYWMKSYFEFVERRMDSRLFESDRYLVFPVGNSFYASRQCLDSIRAWLLCLQSELIEPLPKDGTPLHAAERLLCFSAELCGKQTACTEFFRA